MVFLSFIGKILHNISYYTFYVWINVSDWWNSFTNEEEEDEISISHIYFRPTSAKRKHPSYNIKELIWEIDGEELDGKCLWQYTKDHLQHRERMSPQVGDTLEVHYTVPHRSPGENKVYRESYIVPYCYPAQIIFPPYSQQQIEEYHQSDGYKNGVLSAEIGERDITNEVKRWIGPLNNFYSDKPFREGMCVTRSLIVGSSNIDLTIANTKATEFTFSKNDVLSLEQKPQHPADPPLLDKPRLSISANSDL